MIGAPLRRPRTRKRTMVTRMILHGFSTGAGVAAMELAHSAPMWLRMALYAGSWVGCALVYVPVLYLREHIVEAFDERTRRIIRDEIDRRELLAYARQLERERSFGNRAGDKGESGR